MEGRPNILLLFSDQHHAKVLGHKGHPDVHTPHLDRRAAEGVRFDNAITQNPICTPSRTCWLSGQYCHNHGYYGLSGPNPGGLPTLFGHLRRHGYRTGAVGKIHCPEYWVEDDVDFFLETCGSSIGGRSAAFADYLAERGLTDLEDHGAMQEFGAAGRQTCDARPSKVSYEDGQEGYLTRAGIDFMRRCADAGQPFFLQANFPKPHQCYTPAQPFWDLYDEDALTLPPNADHDLHGKAPHFKATVQRWRTTDWQLFEPRTFEAGRLRKLHGYLGNISHVDHAVGEFLQFLDDAGIADNTIVVYSSDHGDYAAEFGIMEKAPGICSDAITRVPFIWRWPGRFPAAHVADELVESVDFAATGVRADRHRPDGDRRRARHLPPAARRQGRRAPRCGDRVRVQQERAQGAAIATSTTRWGCSPASASSGGSAVSRSCTTWRPTRGNRKTSPCCRSTAPP